MWTPDRVREEGLLHGGGAQPGIRVRALEPQHHQKHVGQSPPREGSFQTWWKNTRVQRRAWHTAGA